MTEDDAVEAGMLAQYLEFTASPTRDRATREQDYYALRRVPLFERMAFLQPHRLAVKTGMIYIHHEHEGKTNRHRIGEFIIYITRERVDRQWEVAFEFSNTTEILSECYHHPHILSKNDGCDGTSDDYTVGTLCISRGQHGVYQAIRTGRIHDAIATLIGYLQITNGMPYHAVTYWPIEEGE